MLMFIDLLKKMERRENICRETSSIDSNRAKKSAMEVLLIILVSIILIATMSVIIVDVSTNQSKCMPRPTWLMY